MGELQLFDGLGRNGYLEVAGIFGTHGLDVGVKLIRRRDFAQCDGQVVVVNTAASSPD